MALGIEGGNDGLSGGFMHQQAPCPTTMQDDSCCPIKPQRHVLQFLSLALRARGCPAIRDGARAIHAPL